MKVCKASYLFAAAFINWSTECEKRALLMIVHTSYGEIVGDLMGDMGHRTCAAEDLGVLESTDKDFKKLLVQKLDEPFLCRLYSAKRNLVYHMLEVIR